MAMNYTDLVAAKTTAGSIANWFNYNRLDLPNVLDEAQTLLYQYLRVREMRGSWTFSLAEGRSRIALPSGFLDPNGQLISPSHYLKPDLRTASYVEESRTYEEEAAVTLGTDAFTTTENSKNISVASTGHDLTQGSIITVDGADVVGGLTLDEQGFPVTSLTDDDTFVIEAPSAATSAATGGGAAASYVASKLLAGYPDCWAITEECAIFDVAMAETVRFRIPCYRMPALLSATNLTNFLTTRYPHLLRKACMAKAADMQKDTEEYNKHVRELVALVDSVNAKDDLSYYGAVITTENP